MRGTHYSRCPQHTHHTPGSACTTTQSHVTSSAPDKPGFELVLFPPSRGRPNSSYSKRAEKYKGGGYRPENFFYVDVNHPGFSFSLFRHKVQSKSQLSCG